MNVGEIPLLSVYVDSQSSPEILFSSYTRIYLGPAPLTKSVLDKLSVGYLKCLVASLTEGSDKSLEHRSV